MKRTVGSLIVSIFLSSVLLSGASLMAASSQDELQSSGTKKSAVDSVSAKKAKHKAKHKLSKAQKKRSMLRARALKKAQKKEKHVAHMRKGLKKVAKHDKKAKSSQVATAALN